MTVRADDRDGWCPTYVFRESMLEVSLDGPDVTIV